MRSHRNIDQIADLLALFSLEVSVRRKSSLTDTNRFAQDVVRRLYRIIFGLKDLQNLDITEKTNSPAVDLGDDVRRVSVQVTSDGSADKIKKTFASFESNGLGVRYDSVKFFILTKRQDRYGPGVAAAIPEGISFDPKRDVHDPDSLLPLIQALNPVDQLRVLDVLEDEFGEGGLHWAEVSSELIEQHEATFVPPKQFGEALASLTEGKLLILTGPPHVGKSSTALGLLVALRGEEKERRVLKLSVDDAIKRSRSLRGELIVIDDAFGEVELKNTDGANSIIDLEHLAHNNRVVVTSRKSVLEEARRRTKLGESVSPRRSVVELNQEGSYDDESLAEVLDRHLAFQSSENYRTGPRIPLKAAEEIRRLTGYIVHHLRFPHNIERLVSAWDMTPVEGRYVDELIARSKDIEQATRRWYEELAEEPRLAVCLCALFPQPTVRERTSIVAALGIQLVNERILARDSGGYLTYGQTLELIHPSYREGVLRALRGGYLQDAAKVLRTAARNLEKLDFSSVSRLKLAYGLFETGRRRYEAFLPDEDVSAQDYYLRYIRSYNALIELDFPKLRHVFKPHSPGESRIHLYLTENGDVHSWTLIERKPDGPEVTESKEVPGLWGSRRTSVEREQLEIDSRLPLTFRMGGHHRRTVPEIEALNDLLKQLKHQLESKNGIHVGSTLRLADLMQDLESTSFPVDEIRPDRPLSARWIAEWARPFFNSHSTGIWPTDREGRLLRFTLLSNPPRINELDVEWAMSVVESLYKDGIIVDGPLLVKSDLPHDRPFRRFPVGNRSDWYSDEAMIRAVENGLRRHHKAVQEILAEAFPTIYRQMSNQWTRPLSVVCAIDRDVKNYMERPSISMGYRHHPKHRTADDYQLEVHLISYETSPPETDRLRSLRKRFLSSEEEFVTVGSKSFSSLVDLKEWRQNVLSDVRRALDIFLEHEEDRLFRRG